MALTEDRAAGGAAPPHFCQHCGAPARNGQFCAACGQPLGASAEQPTTPMMAVTPPPTTAAPPPMAASAPPLGPPPPGPPRPLGPPPPRESNSRTWLIAAGAVGLAAIAIAAIIIAAGSGGGSTTNSSYQQKLTGVLAPVLTANQTLSSSLQSLQGSNTSSAKNATSSAQQAVVAARGAAGVLNVPSGQTQLSEQVQQALAQESGYLQAVQGTLSNPSGDNSQLQTLSTNTQSALVPLGAVAPGISASLSGTSALSSWASGQAAAARRHHPSKPAPQATTTTTVPVPTPAPTPSVPSVPTGGGCGDGVTAGANTTCPFALAVHQAWVNTPGVDNTVQAYSPVTHQSYTMSCSETGGGIITCTGGNNASVSFPG